MKLCIISVEKLQIMSWWYCAVKTKKARNYRIALLFRASVGSLRLPGYFFFEAFFPFGAFAPTCLITACAAARRAIGTRNGEQLT